MTTLNETKSKIQDDALEKVIPLSRAGIAASMGIGKTLIGLRHMARNYHDFVKFLVVAPKRSILDSWKDEAKKHNLEHLLEHIDFTTYVSLNKKDPGLYDVVYLDECHSLLGSHEEWLDLYEGKILGLTGTPPRYERSEKGKLVSKFCPIVYEYETDQAVEDKILNDYKIIVHTIPLDNRKTLLVKGKENSWYSSEQAVYNYWCNRLDATTSKKSEQVVSIMRMKALMEFPSKELLAVKLFNASTVKCILFANTQNQAERLCKNTYHSNNPESEKTLLAFKEGVITKMACVLQLNEGANIPDLKEGIILHAYGNERKASQRIGRLLRLNPKDVATVHILCYRDTVDEKWVKQALETFDQSKIIWKHDTLL